MKTVVIPCFNRPEYLDICIEYIKKANNYDKYTYIFCCDYGFDKRNIPIIEKSGLNYHIIETKGTNYTLGKQSYNVINGLLSAAYNSNLLFYIEEDIFIGKDFFDNAEKIINDDLFCLIQSRNMNGKVITGQENEYYILENTNCYQGIGVCFNPKKLIEYLLPHHINSYYKNPIAYIDTMFNSTLRKEYAEQDGLIRRIIEKNKLKVAFTCLPRCFHAGIYGYNRYSKIDHKRMSYIEKKEFIRKYAFSKENLLSIVRDEYLFRDSEPIDLTIDYKGGYKIKE